MHKLHGDVEIPTSAVGAQLQVAPVSLFFLVAVTVPLLLRPLMCAFKSVGSEKNKSK